MKIWRRNAAEPDIKGESPYDPQRRRTDTSFMKSSSKEESKERPEIYHTKTHV